MTDYKGVQYRIDSVEGSNPTQGEACIGNQEEYVLNYYARRGEWDVQIHHGDEPDRTEGNAVFSCTGLDPWHGDVPYDVARSVIERCIQTFIEQQYIQCSACGQAFELASVMVTWKRDKPFFRCNCIVS
jgi:hypothetical protein